MALALQMEGEGEKEGRGQGRRRPLKPGLFDIQQCVNKTKNRSAQTILQHFLLVNSQDVFATVVKSSCPLATQEGIFYSLWCLLSLLPTYVHSTPNQPPHVAHYNGIGDSPHITIVEGHHIRLLPFSWGYGGSVFWRAPEIDWTLGKMVFFTDKIYSFGIATYFVYLLLVLHTWNGRGKPDLRPIIEEHDGKLGSST